MLGNVSVVVVGDAKIKQDVEEEREIEDNIIKSIIPGANNILNCAIDAQNPKGFYQ